MSVGERLSSVVERMQEHAAVEAVYGAPVERDGKTIIPVAKIAYGFGGGYGSEGAGEERTKGEGESAEAREDGPRGGEGGGMGGGLSAAPAGVVEITDNGTRFIAQRDTKKFLLVALAFFAVGYLLGRD